MRQSIPKVRVTAIKVDVRTLRDLMDMASIETGRYARCAGGRVVLDGYMCIHCREDPTMVHEENGKRFRRCGAPFEANLPQSIDDIDVPIMMEG